MTDNISNINDKQVLLEREMREHGLSRYHKNNFKKAERQQESTTDYGQHLLRATLESLETSIAGYVESSLHGKAGRAATGLFLFSLLSHRSSQSSPSRWC